MMVTGLPYDATEDDVRSYLEEQCGDAKRISVPPGNNSIEDRARQSSQGNIRLFFFSFLVCQTRIKVLLF